MTSRNRETLKNFFRGGQRPDEDHFKDLIDSMLNMTDEGFRKSVEHGLEVSAPNNHDQLLSFFHDQNPHDPMWTIRFNRANDQLLIQKGVAGQGRETQDRAATTSLEPLLCLDPGQRLGIGTGTPRAELDVAGVVRSTGRMGTLPKVEQVIQADGQWHTLIADLVGCQGFEIVAGAGGSPGAGRFSLMHAIALSTFNPTSFLALLTRRRGIRFTHACYGRFSDRMDLRWAGQNGRDAVYRLEIRTRSRFGDGVTIKVHISQIWFEPMAGARTP